MIILDLVYFPVHQVIRLGFTLCYTLTVWLLSSKRHAVFMWHRAYTLHKESLVRPPRDTVLFYLWNSFGIDILTIFRKVSKCSKWVIIYRFHFPILIVLFSKLSQRCRWLNSYHRLHITKKLKKKKKMGKNVETQTRQYTSSHMQIDLPGYAYSYLALYLSLLCKTSPFVDVPDTGVNFSV